MVLADGVKYEEETLALIRLARAKSRQAELEVRQAESEARVWRDYADLLEKSLELGKRLNGDNSNGHKVFEQEHLRTQSTWASLTEIIAANKGLLIVVDAISILVNAGVFTDRKHAGNVIYTTLANHGNQIERLRRGVYRLKEIYQQDFLP